MQYMVIIVLITYHAIRYMRERFSFLVFRAIRETRRVFIIANIERLCKTAVTGVHSYLYAHNIDCRGSGQTVIPLGRKKIFGSFRGIRISRGRTSEPVENDAVKIPRLVDFTYAQGVAFALPEKRKNPV
jgi:hypothetical protein